ncbi:hypothetical protein OG21DRAFT_1489429 [Imleria badia]|nr:hypothetical protein OG21DRAFT_1489429 [Imleria badia]
MGNNITCFLVIQFYFPTLYFCLDFPWGFEKHKREDVISDLPPTKRSCPVAEGTQKIFSPPQALKHKREDGPSNLPPAKRSSPITQGTTEGTQKISSPPRAQKRKREDDPSHLPPAKRSSLITQGTQEIPSAAQDRCQVVYLVFPFDSFLKFLTSYSDPDPEMQKEEDLSDLPPTKHMPQLEHVLVSVFTLPDKLLHEIINLLSASDLQSCTHVSTIFKNIAAPRYLTALGFMSHFWYGGA